MSTPRVLAFAGSIRKDSYNKRLAKIALHAAEKSGAETTFIDLHDFQMPLYCQDYEKEHGIPDTVVEFKKLLKNHNGFIIASPEYNSSLTGILKNTIDWSTRSFEGEDWNSCWNGKIAGILCAASGQGGRNGLYHLRTILSTYGTIVLPKHVIVGNCNSNIQNDEVISDEQLQKQVVDLANEMLRVVHCLH